MQPVGHHSKVIQILVMVWYSLDLYRKYYGILVWH